MYTGVGKLLVPRLGGVEKTQSDFGTGNTLVTLADLESPCDGTFPESVSNGLLPLDVIAQKQRDGPGRI